MVIPEEIRRSVLEHAEACAPDEACGLLAVDENGRLRKAYCLTNVERSPSRFTIDPDEHFASIRDADDNGWVIGGVFHSHPRTEAAPSRIDIAGALDPRWFHLIVGLGDGAPEMRMWSIRDGRAEEIPMEAGEETSWR